MARIKIEDFTVGVIQRTNNPVAPIIMQQAYSGLNSLGGLLAPISEQEKVKDIQAKLMSAFDDSTLNDLSRTPEFSLALAYMLKGAMIELACDSVRF